MKGCNRRPLGGGGGSADCQTTQPPTAGGFSYGSVKKMLAVACADSGATHVTGSVALPVG